MRVYIWLTNLTVAYSARQRRDDRGAVSVEQAILIGVVATVAVAVGTALTLLVGRKVGEWSGI